VGKNVIPFRRRKGARDSEKVASRGSRIIVRVGRRRYAIDISCAATALAAACGLKPTPEQVAALRLRHHETLPEWNTPSNLNCEVVFCVRP
jgi:hypothetical protein